MPVTEIVHNLDFRYLDMNSKNFALEYNIISYMKWSIYDVQKVLLFNLYVLSDKKTTYAAKCSLFYFIRTYGKVLLCWNFRTVYGS